MGGSSQPAQPQPKQFVGGPFPTVQGPTGVQSMPHHYYRTHSQLTITIPSYPRST
jgi:hypothetical protein